MVQKFYCPDCYGILRYSKLQDGRMVCKKCNTMHELKNFKRQQSLANYDIEKNIFI